MCPNTTLDLESITATLLLSFLLFTLNFVFLFTQQFIQFMCQTLGSAVGISNSEQDVTKSLSSWSLLQSSYGKQILKKYTNRQFINWIRQQSSLTEQKEIDQNLERQRKSKISLPYMVKISLCKIRKTRHSSIHQTHLFDISAPFIFFTYFYCS